MEIYEAIFKIFEKPEEQWPFLLLIATAGTISIVKFVLAIKKSRRLNEISNAAQEFTTDQFWKLRKEIDTITGIYILMNHDKKLVYVGQGQDVIKRVESHFYGRGNGDVYADYKYGDNFTIKLIKWLN